MNIPSVTPQQLHDAVQAGRAIELIDVRTPAEFRAAHVALARNVPLHDVPMTRFAGGTRGTDPLYLICRSGNRSGKACEALLAAGYENVINVVGGVHAWEQAGLPVVRGKGAISLERQVRIAAGLLVLTASILAIVVHPWWIALAALVGGGLVFAGISDTCGMALLLARMPWNQIGAGQDAPAGPETAQHSSTRSCCG